jgi:AcrR family transcriptional regulator
VPATPPRKSPSALKSTRRELLRESILEAASNLFIQRGFQGTSMGDIAEAMGATRTALYYYFRNKEAILQELVSEVTVMAGTLASQAADPQADPAQALRQMVKQHARLILGHPVQFRVVERNEENLPAPLRKSAQAARRQVLDRFEHTLQAGMQAGQFQVVAPKVAAFAILGMCNWCAWWFDPKGAVPLDEVADMLAQFALRAVAGADEACRPGDSSVDASLRRLREDLALLEKRLQG